MEFVFTGFRQREGIRDFSYEGIADDRSRLQFVVSANIDLLRRHGVSLQEAPLVCLRFLENYEDHSHPQHLVFTEQLMIGHEARKLSLASANPHKRPPRRSRPAHLGPAPQPL